MAGLTVQQALARTGTFSVSDPQSEVEKTCQSALGASGAAGNGSNFDIAVLRADDEKLASIAEKAPEGNPWIYVSLDENGAGQLVASVPNILYLYTTRLLEDWQDLPVSDFAGGRYFQTAFRWHRPLFDYLLTQMWRTACGFDPEEHIQDLARTGYTHVEVNGIAGPTPYEESVPGEFYSQFYNYCFGLDQFVYSTLNKGVYPMDYLSHNLGVLKRYAKLAQKYGLAPGMLCFEPRTVPEKFFNKYPTLRGARVDHPYRSRKPRYTLTHAHPLVREHYTEMVQRLMQEVPELSCISVWSNDSGAGFEYTSSLYVGRNGGPYLIREWRTHEQIAEVAGKNIVDFLKILRDAAATTNPDFKVALRLEPFKVEHDHILEALEPNLDIEVPSLLVRGYELPYSHPQYPDHGNVAGSVQHTALDAQEEQLLSEHSAKGLDAHLVYTHGNGFNFEPLFGLPFPKMLHAKLSAMRSSGFKFVANIGGLTPRSLAPFHINQEVFRAFMSDQEVELEAVLAQKAKEWAGQADATLREIWEKAGTAIRWLPMLPLYSGFGFVWYRLWVRPFVPDLHAVPEPQRQYYEDFMVTMPNNTNMVDMGRDVLFDLISREYGLQFLERVDEHVLPHLDQAIALSKDALASSSPDTGRAIFLDHFDRLRALSCWIRTMRSVGGWVGSMYGYLGTEEAAKQKKYHEQLQSVIDSEVENAKALKALLADSQTHFMAMSKTGETAYMYGENLPELVERKIALIAEYRHVTPRIDDQIMWKTA